MKRLLAAALAAASLAFGAPAIAQTPPNVLIVGQIAEPTRFWNPDGNTALSSGPFDVEGLM